MEQVAEAQQHIPDFFICDHLQRADLRRRMAAAYETNTLHEQGMTVKEIAALLGIHRTTVSNRLDNWRVYTLWARQSGKCAGRVRQLVTELQKG